MQDTVFDDDLILELQTGAINKLNANKNNKKHNNNKTDTSNGTILRRNKTVPQTKFMPCKNQTTRRLII